MVTQWRYNQSEWTYFVGYIYQQYDLWGCRKIWLTIRLWAPWCSQKTVYLDPKQPMAHRRSWVCQSSSKRILNLSKSEVVSSFNVAYEKISTYIHTHTLHVHTQSLCWRGCWWCHQRKFQVIGSTGWLWEIIPSPTAIHFECTESVRARVSHRSINKI